MDRGTETGEETRTKIEEETGMEMEEEMEIGIVTIMGMETMTGMREELCKLPMVPEEEDKVERYIWGLPESIQRNVTSFAPTRLHDDIRMASNLMDRSYMTRDCKTPDTATNQRAPLENQKTMVTCYECGRQGHYKSECPKLNNQNRGNQVWNNEARGRAFALGGGEANQDSNFGTGTFLLNNCYASILFDFGVDRSFVSTTFSSLIDIIPTGLYVSYAVELADDRVVGSDSIIRGCTLNLINHPFNKDLMPVELGSFN
ncbi:reverse transcriptase domain-containing protein [Tanacetum coccineum]